jgi:hypothetical protein
MTNFLPLYIYGFLAVLGLGVAYGRHGMAQEPKNAWVTFIGFIIEAGLLLWFLLLNNLL